MPASTTSSEAMANLFDTARGSGRARALLFPGRGLERERSSSRAWKKREARRFERRSRRARSRPPRATAAAIENGEGRFGIYNLQRSFLDFLEAMELREEKIAAPSARRTATRAPRSSTTTSASSREIISDFEQIHFQSDPQRKYDTFAGFLHYQAASIYPEGWLEARYVRPDAVQMMTIHQAKGLQWPAVFVPGSDEGAVSAAEARWRSSHERHP